ncbi:MAG: hypothetical protein EBY45_15335 [Gammaproteobacteria bacterium]|nr:hypothetical protein [Gammaproteobacteria bacterium]
MGVKKVLVVDDEASIREMLRLALELSDFECLEAAEIQTAYAAKQTAERQHSFCASRKSCTNIVAVITQ